MDIIRHNCNGRFHEAVAYNGTLYLSGQVASGSTVTEQAENCLNQLEATLRKYGSGKEQILSATVFLADMKDFAAFNSVWDKWFENGSQPVRTCIGAQLAAPQYAVEITLVATVRDSADGKGNFLPHNDMSTYHRKRR